MTSGFNFKKGFTDYFDYFNMLYAKDLQIDPENSRAIVIRALMRILVRRYKKLEDEEKTEPLPIWRNITIEQEVWNQFIDTIKFNSKAIQSTGATTPPQLMTIMIMHLFYKYDIKDFDKHMSNLFDVDIAELKREIETERPLATKDRT